MLCRVLETTKDMTVGNTVRCAKKMWKARRKCIVRQIFYEDSQYLESQTLWFTTVKSNLRYIIRRNPEILESLLEESTCFDVDVLYPPPLGSVSVNFETSRLICEGSYWRVKLLKGFGHVMDKLFCLTTSLIEKAETPFPGISRRPGCVIEWLVMIG